MKALPMNKKTKSPETSAKESSSDFAFDPNQVTPSLTDRDDLSNKKRGRND